MTAQEEKGFVERLAAMEREIAAIRERNARVEGDKRWEVSNCRKLSILGLTYTVALLAFFSMGTRYFYLDALIPTLGYFLSTRSLPVIRHWWESFGDGEAGTRTPD